MGALVDRRGKKERFIGLIFDTARKGRNVCSPECLAACSGLIVDGLVYDPFPGFALGAFPAPSTYLFYLVKDGGDGEIRDWKMVREGFQPARFFRRGRKGDI